MGNVNMLERKRLSEELDRKMEMIRWAIKTLKADLLKVAGQGRTTSCTHGYRFSQFVPSLEWNDRISGVIYAMEVGYSSTLGVVVDVNRRTDDAVVHLDPENVWPSEAIELVYDNLDALNAACLYWRTHSDPMK